MIETVDDLMKELERCKEIYPEFGKYLICVDIAHDYDMYPILRSPKLYVNTDIGQVEIFGENDDE